jgi:LL-H family phage holin
MSAQTIALLQVLIPTIVAVLVYAYHQAFQRLPAKQQADIVRQQEALTTLVPHAVQMSEQLADPTTSGREKKMVALGMIKTLLVAFKVVVPSDEVLSTLIESTVYALNQSKAVPIASASTQELIVPPVAHP